MVHSSLVELSFVHILQSPLTVSASTGDLTKLSIYSTYEQSVEQKSQDSHWDGHEMSVLIIKVTIRGVDEYLSISHPRRDSRG